MTMMTTTAMMMTMTMTTMMPLHNNQPDYDNDEDEDDDEEKDDDKDKDDDKYNTHPTSDRSTMEMTTTLKNQTVTDPMRIDWRTTIQTTMSRQQRKFGCQRNWQKSRFK